MSLRELNLIACAVSCNIVELSGTEYPYADYYTVEPPGSSLVCGGINSRKTQQWRGSSKGRETLAPDAARPGTSPGPCLDREMMSYVAYVDIAIETLLIFGAFFVIGTFIRGQMLAGGVMKMLIFFAIVALAGALTGAHYAPIAIARHNQPVTHQ